MIITAHSGCDGTVPNSSEYLKYAFSTCANAIEVDVRMHNGELVLSHDVPNSDTVTLKYAFEMLKQHPDKKMNCDLKHYGLERAVYDLAAAAGVASQLIYTGDVDPEIFGTGCFSGVEWYANMNNIIPDIEGRLDSMNEAEYSEILNELLLRTSETKATGINWYFKHADLIWDKAKQYNLGISIWTVDDEELIKKYISKSPNNLTTNKIKFISDLT